MTLEKNILILVCVIVALSLIVTSVLISREVGNATIENIENQAVSISKIVALSPIVIEGLSGQRDIKEMQAFTNKVMDLTKVNYVVVFNMQGIRVAHPNSKHIGTSIITETFHPPVLQGKEVVLTGTGTMGLSLGALTPVFDKENQQVGGVAVGILLNNVQDTVNQSQSRIYIGLGVGLFVGIIGAILLSKRLKKVMFGLEPSDIAKLLQERSAMLESIREGILAVDSNGNVTLANAEAVRLFQQVGISDVSRINLDELVPNSRVKKVLETAQAELDLEYNLHGITLLSNTVALNVEGKIVGAISTFRDKTDIKQLAEELSGVKVYAEALRAQTHEFMNKIHVILGMIHMKSYDRLAHYVSQIENQYQIGIGSAVRKIKDPVLAGFILGKISYAREIGCEIVLNEECFLPQSADSGIIHDLVTIVGNLLDNALEAVAAAENKEVDLKLVYDEEELLIEVKDYGPGISEEIKKQIFEKGYSTKANNRGFGLFLVNKSVVRRNGQMEVSSQENKETVFRIYLPYKMMEESYD